MVVSLRHMRTLLIDNYDSYTYNLYHLLAKAYGTEPVVVRNDDPAWSALDLTSFDAAIISPGPGRPDVRRDFGHSESALKCATLPVLGVCLGHQGIGSVAGARVVTAPQPRHGHLTRVSHTGDPLFAGIPQKFIAVRYHSLCLTEPLPADLEAIAWSEDQVIMSLRHRRLPQWGVQFHPESVCTEHGARLLENFRELALARRDSRSVCCVCMPRPVTSRSGPTPIPLRAYVLRLDHAVDTQEVYARLYGASQWAFWLDSSRAEPGLSRYSFLGSADGPGGEVLTFRAGEKSVTVESSGSLRAEQGDIFDALARRLGTYPVDGVHGLPFVGGYVGYFGYELRTGVRSQGRHRARTPDAMWMRADRYVAVDHIEGRTYVVAVAAPGGDKQARSWACQTADSLCLLGAARPGDKKMPEPPARQDLAPWLVRPRRRYLADIEECQRMLRAGESYEICLTNKLRLLAPPGDLEYYRRLRQLNPAPHAALLRLGEFTVFSSSPERFLRVSASRVVETKPIKGTTPRSMDPLLDDRLRRSLQSDAKTRAENLMIVDLLRNDLGKVSDIGSVHVPSFMVTETYATVHQLVTTIRSRLKDGYTALDCVRACFPGGSMTGAPKLRTMEILDSLETEARGVYSGTLGYLGFDGAADLSIVIRSAVRYGDEFTVGAGGAIVLESDPQAEYDEMLLKAEAPLRALPWNTPWAAKVTRHA